MGLLDKVRAKLGEAATTLDQLKNAGASKDILECAVAGAVIIGAADGDFSDKEKGAAIDFISNSKFVSAGGFKTSDITGLVQKFSDYFPASRSGRNTLLEEIREAAARPQVEPHKTQIFLLWVDIADAEGGIDDKERDALLKCGDALKLHNAAALID